ncbi:type II toxin-antitoxin system YhaV family toxin [Alloacidobacterium dinghuense]|uniref:Type II toxin-antitoxin system YhaV family toxin n=1 Tax=Alloacidobacterium dinghuense TaxID=2763107 RepID=A0A7G8BDU7_9BACT|nr:type II toxin-antitoxin system YhaV family toxin [Alloacidobacterium dinghuense]QNI30717.1 type II toxin-antitoxin system YhaV family toxin [Alloacidobacterium dinghuense]
MAGKNRKNTGQAGRTSGLPYDVDMTASAEAVYVKLARAAKAAEAAGNYVSANCTTFNMVKDAVKRIIPNDPLNKKYALRGDLSNIFRLRKGRLRVCWIASSKLRRVCILFIAETLRKEGDANDPYAIFQSLLQSGLFDKAISEYGVRISRTFPQSPNKPN